MYEWMDGCNVMYVCMYVAMNVCMYVCYVCNVCM